MLVHKKIFHRDALQCIHDVDQALDIIEEYREYILENDYPDDRLTSEKRKEHSQKSFAIDSLEEWLVDKAFKAPVVKNIESFIHQMDYYSTLYAEDTEEYQMFCCMRDIADTLIGYFL